MCNLSEGIVDRVTEQVTLRNAIENVRALMRNTGWQVEKAMKALDIPESMRPAIIKALAN